MKKLFILLSLLWNHALLAQAPSLKGYNNPPKGWKIEVIHFPFEFAPDIPLVSSEELKQISIPQC